MHKLYYEITNGAGEMEGSPKSKKGAQPDESSVNDGRRISKAMNNFAEATNNKTQSPALGTNLTRLSTENQIMSAGSFNKIETEDKSSLGEGMSEKTPYGVLELFDNIFSVLDYPKIPHFYMNYSPKGNDLLLDYILS